MTIGDLDAPEQNAHPAEFLAIEAVLYRVAVRKQKRCGIDCSWVVKIAKVAEGDIEQFGAGRKVSDDDLGERIGIVGAVADMNADTLAVFLVGDAAELDAVPVQTNRGANGTACAAVKLSPTATKAGNVTLIIVYLNRIPE